MTPASTVSPALALRSLPVVQRRLESGKVIMPKARNAGPGSRGEQLRRWAAGTPRSDRKGRAARRVVQLRPVFPGTRRRHCINLPPFRIARASAQTERRPPLAPSRPAAEQAHTGLLQGARNRVPSLQQLGDAMVRSLRFANWPCCDLVVFSFFRQRSWRGRWGRGYRNNPVLNNWDILAIARAHDVTAGQVVLRWAIQNGQVRGDARRCAD